MSQDDEGGSIGAGGEDTRGAPPERLGSGLFGLFMDWLLDSDVGEGAAADAAADQGSGFFQSDAGQSLLKAGIGAGTSALFGDSGSGGLGRQDQLAQAQLGSLEAREALFRDILSRINGFSDAPPPVFEFNAAAGGPAGTRALVEGLQPQAKLRALMSLLSASPAAGTGAVNAGAQLDFLGQQDSAARQQQLAGNAATIIADILAENRGPSERNNTSNFGLFGGTGNNRTADGGFGLGSIDQLFG